MAEVSLEVGEKRVAAPTGTFGLLQATVKADHWIAGCVSAEATGCRLEIRI